MAFKLPWSNFHELNLDWILEKIKELREDVDNITGAATPYTSTPEMDGIGSPGTEVSYARGDHRHPTDTSRAAATDLAQEILDRGAADDTLQANIDATDAKIKFSSSAPLMDSSSASAGFSDYMARADHIHPTDTSRASATDVATLTARMDAFAGSAVPYDLLPEMDASASSGSVGAYARGNHVHPSDTSKLDKSGGTITGDLTVNGSFIAKDAETFGTTSATGWLRVIEAPNVQGTSIDITITRKGSGTPGEVHKIKFIGNTAQVFVDETSLGPALYINKIRYSSAGAIDIHMDQTYPADIGVKINAISPTQAASAAIKVKSSMAFVSDTPDGETILASYDFTQNTIGDISDICSIEQSTGGTATIVSAERQGKVVQLCIKIATASSVAPGSNTFTGTFTGPRPVSDTKTGTFQGSNYSMISLKPNGDITVRQIIGTANNGDEDTYTLTYLC